MLSPSPQEPNESDVMIKSAILVPESHSMDLPFQVVM